MAIILVNCTIKLMLCFTFLIFSFYGGAQSNELLNRTLPEITVADSLDTCDFNGKYANQIYPLTFNQQEFVESLFRQGVVLNAYGPGQLSTMIIRGTYGYMNKILWEGIAIDNDLIGQTDISTITPFANEGISVIHDGAGNGTTGSELNIQQIQSRSNINQLQLGGQVGEFNTYGLNGGWQYGRANLQSNTAVSLLRSKNNFSYRDNGIKRIRQGSEVQQIGVKNAMDYQWGSGNEVGYRIWMQSSDRQIPSPVPSAYKGTIQSDLSKRVLLYWRKINKQNEWIFKTAFFDQSLNYLDSTVLINFNGKTQKWVNRINYNHFWSPYSRLETSLQYDLIKAYSTGFAANKLDRQGQFKARYSKTWPAVRIFASAFASQRYAFGQWQPSTYGSQLKWQPRKRWSTEVTLDKYLSIPSFNDLYWAPGGNSNLLSTTGWGGHLNVKYAFDFPAQISLETYQKSIQNQILWLPINAFFTAVNVPLVWSRGFVIASSFEWSNPIHCRVETHFERTLSTYESQRLPNDDVIGKQLIYIPKNQAVIVFDMHYKGWGLKLNDRWVSKRYTASDNNSFLPSYNLLNTYLSKTFSKERSYNIEIIAGALNVLNTQYALQYGWPMPGRQLNIEFIFKIDKN